MNASKTDTCHCIVRHPDKAKFLAVKHEESWSPPVLMFPSGQIDFLSYTINQGMLDKYGLQTRILRPIIHLPNYHCVEMELAAAKSSRNIKAVWVDQAEYLRTRSLYEGVPDPFELWFEEQEAGKPVKNRPPFHKPGWFSQADHWIHFQLDRLGIQVTGSVEQYRQGWTASSLLRVPTSQGWIYFKAAYEAPPGEAVLTDRLAQSWPRLVNSPLVIDAQRNWMLNRDFRAEGPERIVAEQLPDFARKLAEWQIDSRQSLQQWKTLGCREFTLGDFGQYCEQQENYRDRVREGGGGLNDSEWTSLTAAMDKMHEVIAVLENTGIPSSLVHTDFRTDNMAIANGELRVLDWSDPIIAHPFLVLGRVFTDHAACKRGRDTGPGGMSIDDGLYQQIIDAYLEPFAPLSSRADLLLALDAARKLDALWMLMRVIHRMNLTEAMSPHYYRLVFTVQARARKLIRDFVG